MDALCMIPVFRFRRFFLLRNSVQKNAGQLESSGTDIALGHCQEAPWGNRVSLRGARKPSRRRSGAMVGPLMPAIHSKTLCKSFPGRPSTAPGPQAGVSSPLTDVS